MLCNKETCHYKATFPCLYPYPNVRICIKIELDENCWVFHCLHTSICICLFHPYQIAEWFYTNMEESCPVIPSWNYWNTDSEMDMDIGKSRLRFALCRILPRALPLQCSLDLQSLYSCIPCTFTWRTSGMCKLNKKTTVDGQIYR